MSAFPAILENARFCLRPLERGDLPHIVRQLSDDRIARWLAAVPQPFGPDEAEAILEHGRQPGEHLRALLVEDALAGCICLGSALWYWLDPAYWRQGLMQSALNTVMAAYFAGPAPPLLASCRTDNTASRGLLAGLGFAQCPCARRMYFQSTGTSQDCTDYLMAPEQWHLLHPPRFELGTIGLRPARQRDAALLARMLPKGRHGPWPTPEDVPQFIEANRFRGASEGLFVVEDENRRGIGMALLAASGAPSMCFLSLEDAQRHAASLTDALAGGLNPARTGGPATGRVSGIPEPLERATARRHRPA